MLQPVYHCYHNSRHNCSIYSR